jgi:hypothetical protein
MAIIKINIKSREVKTEVRDARVNARKFANGRQTASDFLVSTGMYTANGRLKPQFR